MLTWNGNHLGKNTSVNPWKDGLPDCDNKVLSLNPSLSSLKLLSAKLGNCLKDVLLLLEEPEAVGESRWLDGMRMVQLEMPHHGSNF